MSLIIWDRQSFRQRESDAFKSLATRHSQWWYSAVWDAAFRQYTKKFIKTKTYAQYVDNLVDFCIELVSDQLPPPFFANILSTWLLQLESRIGAIARKLQREKLERSHPKQSVRKEMKRVGPIVKKWVDAYKTLAKLPADSHFFTEGNHSIQIPSDHSPAGEKIRLNHLAGYLRKLTDEGSIRVRVVTWEEIPRNYPLRKDEDFLRLVFESGDGKKSCELEVDHRRLDTSVLLSLLQSAILNQAKREFGEIGSDIAHSLFSDHSDILGKRATEPTEAGRGRPEDEFLNKLILELDAKGVDSRKIRRLVDAFQGIDTLSKPHALDEGTLLVRQRTYSLRWEKNARESIRKRIEDLGGNLLRYLADTKVKEQKECWKCTWGWNRKGELVRVFSCPQHSKSKEKPRTSFASKDWVNGFISVKGEEHFANALSWRMRQPKLRRTKIKK